MTFGFRSPILPSLQHQTIGSTGAHTRGTVKWLCDRGLLIHDADDGAGRG
jgi:hypothetical protein